MPRLKGLVTYTFKHEVTGPQLPVLKLDNGTSLVACPLLRTEKVRGKEATVSFNFSDKSTRARCWMPRASGGAAPTRD